eukprot:4743224-Amphidinium_carterae.1
MQIGQIKVIEDLFGGARGIEKAAENDEVAVKTLFHKLCSGPVLTPPMHAQCERMQRIPHQNTTVLSVSQDGAMS